MKNSKKTQKTKSKNKNNSTFQVTNPDAAGIDIASSEHWVCIPPDRTEENVRRFGAFTCDLYEIANWLLEHDVDTVAMESTGIYWIPLFHILESKGIKVYLVNASQVKSVPSRPKTDCLDCQWIQKLHSCGLLRPSFHPQADIRKIRTLMRHRDKLLIIKTKYIQHMQKSLELMNIKLSKVISDITGKTGLAIINDILAGNHNPQKLALHKDPNIKASIDTIAKSLQGDYSQEHLFILQLALDSFQFIKKQVIRIDRQVESYLREMENQNSTQQLLFDFDRAQSDDLPRKRTFRAKSNAPDYDVHSYLENIAKVDLMDIDGIKDSALNIISEIGLDMTKFPSEKHFTSWLGLSPNRKISGGKVLSDRTRKVRSPAARLFRNAASTLRNSKSYPGAFYRKIKSRSGPACAVTATARKLAIIVYHMLKTQSQYVDLGPNYLIEIKKKKIIKNIEKQAKLLGYKISLEEIS